MKNWNIPEAAEAVEDSSAIAGDSVAKPVRLNSCMLYLTDLTCARARYGCLVSNGWQYSLTEEEKMPLKLYELPTCLTL